MCTLYVCVWGGGGYRGQCDRAQPRRLDRDNKLGSTSSE
jgi:hypothetical protein